MNHDFNEIQQRISLVINDIQERFPECHYTVKVLLWDDNTSFVECRHGDGEKIYIASHYNEELSYTEELMKRPCVFEDKVGNQYWTDPNS